jgi:hypothetical protein
MKHKTPTGLPNELSLNVDDLMIVELDDRFELAAAIISADTNYGCNGKACGQNIYCPVK